MAKQLYYNTNTVKNIKYAQKYHIIKYAQKYHIIKYAQKYHPVIQECF